MVDISRRIPGRIPMDLDRDVVMGHEFCCEVVEVGCGVSNLSVGDVVVSLPVAFDTDGLHAVGYSNRYHGGYAELMVLTTVELVQPFEAGQAPPPPKTDVPFLQVPGQNPATNHHLGEDLFFCYNMHTMCFWL